MRPRLTRPAAVLGTLVLTASALLATAGPASAAPGDVTLTVNVIDQYGRPAPGSMQTVDKDGEPVDETTPGNQLTAATHTYTVPSDAGYGFFSVTQWSGLDCLGVSPCSPAPSPTVAPVVTVPADTPTVYTVHVTVPTITGGPAVGSPLTLHVPDGIQRYNAALASAPPPYNTYSTAIPVQWTRAGTDIPGATSSTYTTVRSDGSQSVTARLYPSAAVAAIFTNAGASPQPFTTNAIAISPPVVQKAKVKVKVPKRFRASEKVTMTVKVTSTGTGTPDGKVLVRLGKLKISKTLDDGEVLVTLPRLSAGQHKVSVKYLGSEDFQKAKAKKVTLTVST